MIIRPVCSREFVALPNIVLNDERLSIETREMLAYVLSKPVTWEIRPGPLARALSTKDARLGRTKLARMIREAIAAGYMAKSAEQTHKPDGGFGSFVYMVGLPEDVAQAIEAAAKQLGCDIFSASTFCAAHGVQHAACTHETCDAIIKDGAQKAQNLKINDNDKNLPLPLPSRADEPQASDDGLTTLGRNALACGMHFAFENSKPFLAWRAFRGVDGMPVIDVRIVDGKRRRGSWFPALYPPGDR
jgi:hypothetical protein